MHSYQIVIVIAGIIVFIAGCILIWIEFGKRRLRSDGGGDVVNGPNPFDGGGDGGGGGD